jgi:competence protein ComFA
VKALFVCPRCGNNDPHFIGMKNGKPYCRRCIGFHGDLAKPLPQVEKNVRLSLNYGLSRQQQDLSSKIVENFKAGIDTLVYAVCGSGKTEISYGVLAYAMSRGLAVAFALPRRDVVIELYLRLKDAFPDNKIVAVYGQHTSELEGDCVILTTHQLYRYPHYFDLIVMDEIDAFPFKGDPTLIAFFKRSLRGFCVMMSATPSKSIIQEFKKPGHEILTLRTRYHKKPIPVPVSKLLFGPLKLWMLIRKLREYRRRGKPCMVFVPTVALSMRLYNITKLFVPDGNYVSSKRKQRDLVIKRFKEGKYRYLVTTAVLERGVTIRDLQVIVFGSDDKIYDSAALIQIAGRAGRKADAPNGEVLFLANKESAGMHDAIKEIKYCNTFL